MIQLTVNNSPIQDYVNPDDQTQPTLEMTPWFKPFTVLTFDYFGTYFRVFFNLSLFDCLVGINDTCFPDSCLWPWRGRDLGSSLSP